jgi:hypothetical protein
MQERRISAQRLQFIIDEFVTRQRKPLGLIVDEEDPDGRYVLFSLSKTKFDLGSRLSRICLSMKSL